MELPTSGIAAEEMTLSTVMPLVNDTVTQSQSAGTGVDDTTADNFNFVRAIRTVFEDDSIDMARGDQEELYGTIGVDIGLSGPSEVDHITFDGNADAWRELFQLVDTEDGAAIFETTYTVMNDSFPKEATEETVQPAINADTEGSCTADAVIQTEAVTVTFTDAATTTETSFRQVTAATQTPRDGSTALPTGITLEHIAHLMFASPGTTFADLLFSLRQELPATASENQVSVIETAMLGMDAMARTVIGFLADQRRDGGLSNAAADRARLTVLQQLSALWNRSSDFHPPTDDGVESPPTEEVPRTPTEFHDPPASPPLDNSEDDCILMD